MIRFSKFLNIPVFILSLIFGIFAVYLFNPDTRKIYVYPTPENVDILQHRDKTGQCFKYHQTEVSCPANESEISLIPIQS
jgi:hypothetical protein